MKPIPDTDLGALVADTELDLITEQRREAGSAIRQLFVRHTALLSEQKKKEGELTKIRKKIESTFERIAKLRAGDWSVLTEKEEKEGPEES